jgi:hypothetical protein
MGVQLLIFKKEDDHDDTLVPIVFHLAGILGAANI